MQEEEVRGTRPLAIAILGGLLFAFLYVSRALEALLVFEETIPPLLSASAVALASYACGVFALQGAARLLAKADAEPTRGEAFIIGVPVFGTVAGAVAWLSVSPLPFLAFAGAAGGAAILWRSRGSLAVRIDPAVVILAPAVLLAFIQAITPVVSADELIYKLAIPHAYDLYGRMIELPLNSNAYLAMAMHLADVPALMLGGAIGAKILHFFAYVAALAAVWRLAKRLYPEGAWWSVAVVAYTPTLMFISGWAFTEWIVVGLLVTSFDRYQRWLETDANDSLVISFAAAGAAAAVKYTALPWILPFALLFTWRHRRDRRALAMAVLSIALFGAFFYVRNAVWTGSPVAPMLLPDAPKVDNYRSGYAFSGWVDLARGKDIVDPEISDEALGIVLPLSVLAGVAALRRRDRATRDLLIVGALQTAILLTIAPGTRNMINGAVALALPGTAMLAIWWRASGRALQLAAVTVAALAFAIQTIGPINTLPGVLRYLAGNESEGEYFARTRPFMPVYAWLATTPPNSRVLLLGETRTLLSPRPFVSGGNLDGPRIASWLASFRDPSAMAAEIRRQNITHVVFHPGWYRVTPDGRPPFDMLRSELGLAVNPKTHATLMSFLEQHTKLRYRDREYLVYEVRR